MAPDGVEPPTFGLEPKIMPFNYGAFNNLDKHPILSFTKKYFIPYYS